MTRHPTDSIALTLFSSHADRHAVVYIRVRQGWAWRWGWVSMLMLMADVVHVQLGMLFYVRV